MNVYEFEKSLLERMEESYNVLQCKGSPVPASDVRDEWACHVELKIEPAGWQAIWKINRATCEQYNIKYPTVVLGTVNNIYFQDLMADFSISMVQDDDVHLPEIHEVPLEDLWPTIDQENPELNIDRTADCIDELRFFYRNVWMPWDNDADDDVDWCKKHLESRIRFCFDLKRDMSRGMADHIRKLISEARYIQNKREFMELEMSDDEDAEEDPQKIEGLMRMQLRMIEIRNEIEMLENPVIRSTYEDIHFRTKSNNNNSKNDQKSNVYIVTKEDTITKQMEYFDAVQRMIKADEVVKCMPSLKDCLKLCVSRDQIYLPSGRHSIKLLEPLNSGGFLKAVSHLDNNKAESDAKILESNDQSIITTEENDNVFLSFNGDYTIENVIVDCRLARFGVWFKNGTVTLKNCRLIGDRSSSTGIGIVIGGDAKCVLENTLIENFGTGITCAAGGTLVMNQTSICNCGTALETEDTVNIQITSSQMSNNSDYAIFVKTKVTTVLANGEKRKIVSEIDELSKLIPSFVFNGGCSFDGNKRGNIVIVDQMNMMSLQHSEFLEDNYSESGFKNTDASQNQNEIRMDVSV